MFLATLLLGLSTPGSLSSSQDVSEASVAPPVFRSVLDNRARMITVRLDEGVHLAYDATDCTLYRAWSGDVHFDGAVYTKVHGPQPTSSGPEYATTRLSTWMRIGEGETLPGRAVYRAYRLDDAGTFTLHYDVRFPDGTTVGVFETPRVETADGGALRLVRALHFEGDLDGIQVRSSANIANEWTTSQRVSGALPIRAYPSFGKRRHGELLRLDTDITLTANLLRPPIGKTEAQPATAAAAAPPAPKRGVAPGEIPVERIENDNETYAAYGPRERGVSMRVYDVAVALAELPELVDGQTANVNAVVPRVELFGAASFGGIADGFLTVLEGYLETEAGSYDLRLSSDDGSELFLDGELVIDNDGLHGHAGAEATVELEAGLHPFTIRHFENGGGESIELEWRTPGSDAFVVIPDEAFSCRAGEVRVTSPGNKKVLVPGADRPGFGAPLEDVHPSLSLEPVRPAGFEPKVGGLGWLSDGRLVVCTWDPSGAVYELDGLDDAPHGVTVRRIASGLAEPLGLEVVDDRIFVLQKQELTELVDLDGDGVTDEYRCVCSGWDVTANFHEFAFGLVHKAGRFYANLAIAIDPGGKSSANQVQDRGTTIRIDPDTGTFETVAWGLRTPNGIGLGIDGDIFLTDNQGDWLPVSKLMRLEDGAFYNSRAVLLDASYDLEVTPPVAWLPQNEIGNSPSEPAVLPAHFGPYAGHLIHGEVTHGGVKRVVTEEVDGILQGAVFRFTQGLEAGVNRLSFGPDGKLYVGGIGSTGNWGQAGKQYFGLERLAYTGAPAFEMLELHAAANGFEVVFTEPLAEDWGWDPLAWEITQWRYEPTIDYGGPKLDEETLPVKSIRRMDGGRRLFLELDGLASDRVVHLRIRQPFASAEGRALWSGEAWYTMNCVPAENHSAARSPGTGSNGGGNPNALTAQERADGWELLFDGTSLAHWTSFKSDTLSDGWQVRNGEIARVGPAGDLVTRETFEDFELRLEWRLSHKGNSGIFFGVSDEGNYVWESGPEMQILDNDGHGDGITASTSAGANYALHEPVADVTRPIGQFNEAVLRVEDGHVTHWLNGTKLLEYDWGSDDWKARVANSKFASMPGYGQSRRGHIALQDHGDPVFFRNVKIRRL